MRRLVPLFLTILAIAACGPSGGSDDDDDGPCPNRCTAFGWEECISDGVYQVPQRCEADQVCIEEIGCAVCIPDQIYCGELDQVWMCNGDGTGGTMVEQCPQGQVCGNGQCVTPCQRALQEPSNVGCDFWAADTINEAVTTPILNDAAGQQFALVVANNNDYEVRLQVFKNAGRVGQPLAEELFTEVTAPPRTATQVNLPPREVDGANGQNQPYRIGTGAGTFVSPHAWHLVTSGPVVAYQFNPIVQQFSNDASILIPIQALGKHYYVWGWPTANPCGPPVGEFGHMESIPDHTAITIVGAEDNTQVTVVATHPIAASGGDTGFSIAQTPPGQPITFTINRYDVVNLESDQPVVPLTECFSHLDQDGDFTGSLVTADKKIAVFTALARGTGTGGVMLPDPPNWPDDHPTCCTDHLEEQLLPTTALGREYAISRSPVRSTNPSWQEPDLYRVLSSEDGVTITTNLPGADASFTLNAGQQRTFYTDHGFTLSASGAVTVGQVLISQSRVPDGNIGDPSLVIFPAAEQHRKDYVFLVPTTFRDNYFVLAKPVSGSFTVDGRPLGEFANCQVGPIGVVQGVNYEQVTCPVAEGQHTVAGSEPFGITVYGYYTVGSYAFAGGSDLKIINPIGKPAGTRTFDQIFGR